MVTDYETGRGDTTGDPSPAAYAAIADNQWATVPAELFDLEPEAGRVRANFAEICRRASADQIIASLGAVWLMLDRAALWVSSIHTDFAAGSDDFVNRTCAALLPTIPRRIRTLTYLGRGSLDHLPTAMAAARAVFEAGLRLAWCNSSQDQKERAIRVLLIHNSQAKWMEKVASDYDLSAGGDRWRKAAETQVAMVTHAIDRIGCSKLPQRVPSVPDQLRELGLGRLYSGYRLASEYVHGGLSSALEAELIQTEHSPFGIYWPSDWFLPVNMCAWGCLFLTPYYAKGGFNLFERGFNLGPVRGSMLAAELLFLSPGQGWRQNE